MTDPMRPRHGRAARSWIVALVVLVQTSQSLATVGIALFLPLIRADLGIGYAQAGLFAVVTTVTYAAMQIPAGFLSDRFGPRRMYIIGAIGVNVLSLGFALLPTFGLLLASQAVSGIFRSFMFASGMLLVTRQFPDNRRATAMGLFVALGFSSNVFLNVFGPLMVGELGWRMLFVVFAVLGFAFVAGYAALPDRDGPRAAAATIRAKDLAVIVRSRVLWLCGGMQFVRLAVTMATMAWWPTYLVTEKGFDLTAAGLVLAIGAVLTAPANLIGGYISDRYDRPLAVIAGSLAVIGASFGGILLADSTAALIILISVNQFFLQIYFGPLFEIPVRTLGVRYAGSINGFSNMFANIGALVSVFMMGWLKETLGSFDYGLLLLIGLCCLSLILVAWLRSILPPHTR